MVYPSKCPIVMWPVHFAEILGLHQIAPHFQVSFDISHEVSHCPKKWLQSVMTGMCYTFIIIVCILWQAYQPFNLRQMYCAKSCMVGVIVIKGVRKTHGFVKTTIDHPLIKLSIISLYTKAPRV